MKSAFWQLFNAMPIIGIMRNLPSDKLESVADVYCQSGLTNLEVTMNSVNAVETIAYLVKNFGSRLNIGAGTVCTLDDLENALSAGAKFIVTPVLDEDVIKCCVAKSIPVFPGAYTPTEIYKAWRLGADMVKVFPATKLGPEFIKEILAPLNQLKLLPTGGISLTNFTEFMRVGAKGVGIGSQLFPLEIINNNRWDKLENLYVDIINKYRHYQSENNTLV